VIEATGSERMLALLIETTLGRLGPFALLAPSAALAGRCRT
jgi:hypothetical protein